MPRSINYPVSQTLLILNEALFFFLVLQFSRHVKLMTILWIHGDQLEWWYPSIENNVMSLAPDISGFTISKGKKKKLVSLEWVTSIWKNTVRVVKRWRPIVDIYILHLLSHEDLLWPRNVSGVSLQRVMILCCIILF